MNTGSQVSESLSRIILHPTGGIVALVDDLLAACRDEGLRIEWQNNLCRVRSMRFTESLDVSVPNSVFRAILARVAALCNARKPGSVSPYGGIAELSLGSDPRAVFEVAFVNTASEQKLELNVRSTGSEQVGMGMDRNSRDL